MIDIIELEGKQGNLCRKLNMAGGKDCSSNQSCSITKQIYIYIGFKNSKKASVGQEALRAPIQFEEFHYAIPMLPLSPYSIYRIPIE